MTALETQQKIMTIYNHNLQVSEARCHHQLYDMTALSRCLH